MDKNIHILEKLIKENVFNQKCADCNASFPRWASVNLGIYICQNCAGIHRGLGTHISFIKSISLDRWTEDMIEKMKKNGNEKINKMYEAYLKIQKPKPNSHIDEKKNFIEKKYREKLFYQEIIPEVQKIKVIDLLNFNDDDILFSDPSKDACGLPPLAPGPLDNGSKKAEFIFHNVEKDYNSAQCLGPKSDMLFSGIPSGLPKKAIPFPKIIPKNSKTKVIDLLNLNDDIPTQKISDIDQLFAFSNQSFDLFLK